MNLAVLYRGSLSSCNYACGYCPFAKRNEKPAQLARDRDGLAKFVQWLSDQARHRWRVLFTPWGEALVRRWYREAVIALTSVEHLDSVAVQTNLSGNLDWTAACPPERLAFWATFHPTETALAPFVHKVQRLAERGIRISVGMVGIPSSIPTIVAMRRKLPADVYLWINAQQPRSRPYTAEEVEAFTAIDPQFSLTLRRERSLGKTCRTGEATFTVDGAGDMRRCHFVEQVIGNIHDPAWEAMLRPRACPNQFCDCFLGKAQLKADALAGFFGATLLERLPTHDWREFATSNVGS
jgi:MoaA/NifB/PqqE/SkfB family radical SAM enzyme